MKDFTRQQFANLKAALALGYGVQDVTRTFTVTPTVEQRLNDKIVEQSEFLQHINVTPVDEMSGQNILGSASGPVSGRTDTTVDGAERTPRDVLGLDVYSYQLYQTNSDVYMRYPTMDAWAKFPNFHERYLNYVQRRVANDREMVGWYGKSAAATTDLVANPLLQDVNKGWLQYMRDNRPTNILAEGENAGELRIGNADGLAGADYGNLDHAVADLLLGIPRYLRAGLIALIGDELVGSEHAALYKAIGSKPTEKTLATAGMTLFGGLSWMTPTNFPGRGLVITSLDNLSIYLQSGSWRRRIDEVPNKDRVEDYNSRNEGYVVETPEKFVGVEFENVKIPGLAEGVAAWV